MLHIVPVGSVLDLNYHPAAQSPSPPSWGLCEAGAGHCPVLTTEGATYWMEEEKPSCLLPAPLCHASFFTLLSADVYCSPLSQT